MAKVLISRTVEEDAPVYPECPYAGRMEDGGNGWIIVPCNHPKRGQVYCSSSHMPPVNCPF